MAIIKWDGNMSVGNLAIDRDHRMLIRGANKLHSAVAAGKSKEIVRGILARLVKDVEKHFKREEILWKSGGYVDADKHKRQHVYLLQTARQFQAKYDKGTASPSLDLINFLVLWLLQHILESDKPAAAAIGRKARHYLFTGLRQAVDPLPAKQGPSEKHTRLVKPHKTRSKNTLVHQNSTR